ncbi:hypothetical protein [Algibacillus agarilyticus]|uniref:hypothetical protein n=1 Tax=Algibacillus agarilyticus TaxID=2234133 RepID=UPI000DD03C00|nr:hypothetical protein [Algibacillus agarilyticus]
MNTYIAMHPNNNQQYFATNNKSAEFELRFWQSLAHLQTTGKWLCLIAPDPLPAKAQLIKAGINLDRMLIVHSKSDAQAIKSASNALSHNKCSTVVTWVKHLTNLDHQTIQQSSIQGNTLSILIKTENAFSKPTRLVA